MVLNNKLNSSDTLNRLIILYAFCIPISKAGTTFSAILMILVWFIQGNFKNKWEEIKNSKFLIALLCFIMLNILSIIWSTDKIYALDYVKKYWHLISIFVIYTSLHNKNVNTVISSFLMGMLISEIVSYGIFFEFWVKEGVSPHDPSPFMDHVNYSVYLVLTSFILLNRVFFVTNNSWKLFYFIYFLFVVSNLFINGGRTGQVSFFLCVFIVGFINIKSKIKVVFSSIVIVLVVFSMAYNFSPVFNKKYHQTVTEVSEMLYEGDYSGSISARVGLWITGTIAGMQTPIVGTGIGDEAINSLERIKKYNFEKFQDIDTQNYIDYHNSFIQEFVKLGFIGLFVYISIYYFLFVMRLNSKYLKNLSVIFLLLFSLLGLVGNSFHIMASMVLFSLFSGIFSSQSIERKGACIEKK